MWGGCHALLVVVGGTLFAAVEAVEDDFILAGGPRATPASAARIYMCMCVYVYVCMQNCMHACMHACMYACLYIDIRIIMV